MPTINKGQKKKPTYRKKTTNVSKLYNSQKWVKLRAAYILEHPLCEDCLENGIIKPVEEVHHIRPILTGKDELEQAYLAYNADNLRSLCKECHHKTHQNLRDTV